MGSIEKSKKKLLQWKRAAIHLSLCFVTGFFIGFAPTSSSSIFSIRYFDSYQSAPKLNISQPPQIPTKSLKEIVEPSAPEKEENDSEESQSHNLLIIITTVSYDDAFKEPFLRRLSHSLKLVSAPLLWIVVEAHNNAKNTYDVLKRTGIMCRYLTYKENFTDANVEADHMRNVALNHIEYHRLNGVVHFADVSNFYSLELIEEIREIDMFGVWAVSSMSVDGKRILVDGPICKSSKVVGWHAKEISNGSFKATSLNSSFNNQNVKISGKKEARPSKIDVSTFAFNSSILWDPERWGRPSSILDTSQDSIKFVQEVVLEDDTKLKAIPHDCSQVRLWQLHIPRAIYNTLK